MWAAQRMSLSSPLLYPECLEKTQSAIVIQSTWEDE